MDGRRDSPTVQNYVNKDSRNLLEWECVLLEMQKYLESQLFVVLVAKSCLTLLQPYGL